MAVNYSVADTKLLSNKNETTEETKLRVKLRKVLAKQKGPHKESALDTAQDKFDEFLKQHDEHMTDELQRSTHTASEAHLVCFL